MLIAALQDVAQFMKSDTAEADILANETLKLPPGILTAALASNRLQMATAENPALDPAHRQVDHRHDGTRGEGGFLRRKCRTKRSSTRRKRVSVHFR